MRYEKHLNASPLVIQHSAFIHLHYGDDEGAMNVYLFYKNAADAAECLSQSSPFRDTCESDKLANTVRTSLGVI